jgi:hypothetical protein
MPQAQQRLLTETLGEPAATNPIPTQRARRSPSWSVQTALRGGQPTLLARADEVIE